MLGSSFRRAGAAGLAVLAAVACASSGTTGTSTPAAVPLAGAYVVRLGDDTLAVERFTRTGNRLQGEELVRAGAQSIVRQYTIDYRGDSVTRMEVVVRRAGAPADAPPQRRFTVTVGGDSATVATIEGDSTRTRRVAATAAAIPTMALMYAPYELAISRALRAGTDSTVVPIYALGSASAAPHPIRRIGTDSVAITTPFATLRARVDAEGRILGLHAPGSTFQIVLERVPTVDIASLAASAAARPLGQLSPRDTVRATIGPVTLLVDYGRPMRRGRDIFGNVVAWDRVWRTGANTATHLTTDRDIAIGGTRVPAGTYTLWSIPSPGGWQLIVNKQTKQWGTEYDAAQDLARVPLTTRTLATPVEQLTIAIEPAADGGVLRLAWDRTEASVPITAP